MNDSEKELELYWKKYRERNDKKKNQIDIYRGGGRRRERIDERDRYIQMDNNRKIYIRIVIQ